MTTLTMVTDVHEANHEIHAVVFTGRNPARVKETAFRRFEAMVGTTCSMQPMDTFSLFVADKENGVSMGLLQPDWREYPDLAAAFDAWDIGDGVLVWRWNNGSEQYEYRLYGNQHKIVTDHYVE